MSTKIPRTSEAQYNSEEFEWRYDITPLEGDDNRELVGHGNEFRIEAIDNETGEEDTYAGAMSRAMVENARNNPDQPIMFGVDRKGKSTASPKKRAFEHTLITGQTGEGKSTLGLGALPLQHAYAGDGMCIIDPGGSDSRDFLRKCPASRRDDIVWVDPTATHKEKFVGFNFLETWTQPGEPGFDEEVEMKLWMLLPAMGADEYQRMKGVMSNLLRGLIRANHQDSDYTFTLIDLYFILKDDDSREEYASMVREEKVSRLIEIYANQIAKLSNDDLEPLMRRLQAWVENPIICEVVACRESPISIAEIVESGKILIIRCNANEDVSKLLNSAANRAVWGVANVRPDPMDLKMLEYDGFTIDSTKADHKPFFMFIDEFPAIVNPNMPIGSMLRQARKKKLGLYLMAQQVTTLPSGAGNGDDVQAEVLSNTSVKIAYFPGDKPGEKNVLKKTFKGVNDVDQLNVDPYTAWIKITLEHKRPDAWIMRAIPPIPPLRGSEDVYEWITGSLERYGTKRTSEEEKVQNVPARFGGGATTTNGNADLSSTKTDVRNRLVAKAVFDTSIRDTERENGAPVPLGMAWERVRQYAGQFAVGSIDRENQVFNKLIKPAQAALNIKGDGDGRTMLQATDDALTDLYDNGIAENVGGPDSWRLGRDAYVPMTELGLRFDIPSQDGSNMPDAIASVGDVLNIDDASPREMAKKIAEFENDNKLIAELTDLQDARVELECSTARTKKATTLHHIADAKNFGQKCIILGRDDAVEDAREAAFDEPQFARKRDDSRILYYNSSRKMRIDGEFVYRSGSGDTRWYHDDVAEEYLLADSNGTTHARFQHVEDVFETTDQYLIADDVADTSECVQLRSPFIPEYHFDDAVATIGDVPLIVVPENEPPKDDLLRVHRDGKRVPLVDNTDDANKDENETSGGLLNF